MEDSMLNHIVNITDQYLEEFPKTERKKIGQFFTSNIICCINRQTARF